MKTADFYLLKSRETAQNGQWRDIYVHRVLPNMPDGKNLAITLYPEFADRRSSIEGLFDSYMLMKKNPGVFSNNEWTPVKYEMDLEQPSWAITPKLKVWENKITKEETSSWYAKLKEYDGEI